MYEEGFKEKSWSYKLLNPINAEFSTVIICMFYAMFLEKKLLMKALGIMYQPDIQIFHSLASFCGFLFFISSMAFCLFDDELVFPIPTYLVYNLCLLGPVLVVSIRIIVSNPDDLRPGLQLDQQQPAHKVD